MAEGSTASQRNGSEPSVAEGQRVMDCIMRDEVGAGGRWRQLTQAVLSHVENLEHCPRELSVEGRAGGI